MVTKDTTVIQARVVLRCVPGIIEELDKILARSDTFSSRNQLIMAILDDFIHNNQILDEKTVLVGFPMRPLFRQKIEPAEKAIEKEATPTEWSTTDARHFKGLRRRRPKEEGQC